MSAVPTHHQGVHVAATDVRIEGNTIKNLPARLDFISPDGRGATYGCRCGLRFTGWVDFDRHACA